MRTEAVVDLDAVRDNVRTLCARAGSAQVMAVVKADAYGHGLVPCARAALAGGASWLGVAFLEEAAALRDAGVDAPVLAWLQGPDEDLLPAVRGGIDLGVYGVAELARARGAAGDCGVPARLHLKVDTGLSRGGSAPADWPELCAAAARAQGDGSVRVVGVWSHLACADQGSGNPTTQAQASRFTEALEVARAAGLHPEVRHLVNSAGTFCEPGLHYDLVRPGVAVYGLSPLATTPASELGLRPAMTLRSTVAAVRRVPEGTGVGYGHQHRTVRETTLALVPVGYADGVPRAASGRAEVLLGGSRRPLVGAVSMDQVVVDVGEDAVVAGDPVVLFGPGDRGEPTAREWADAVGTIDYEVVTRIGPRVPRTYVGRQE